MNDKFEDNDQKTMMRRNSASSLSNKLKDTGSNFYNRQDEMREIDDKLKSLELLIKNNLN